MKQISTIRSMLGISQQDMALLLQVHRSQYSMFESGQRDLPKKAKLLLAPMMAEATRASQKQAAVSEQYSELKTHVYLKGLVQENELQRLTMARRLHNTRQLFQKNLIIMKLTTFLSESEGERSVDFKKLVQCIRAKAEQTLTDCNELLLLKYEVKSELLELERLLLEQFTTKHSKDKDFKK